MTAAPVDGPTPDLVRDLRLNKCTLQHMREADQWAPAECCLVLDQAELALALAAALSSARQSAAEWREKAHKWAEQSDEIVAGWTRACKQAERENERLREALERLIAAASVIEPDDELVLALDNARDALQEPPK